MRYLTTSGIVLAMLVGCDNIDVVEVAYTDIGDATSEGAVSRGWVPEWLPPSATDLRQIYSLDTNESALSFNFSQESWRPPTDCNTIAPEELIPSRYQRDWWPAGVTVADEHVLFSCPPYNSHTSTFVAVHRKVSSALHWRVSVP